MSIALPTPIITEPRRDRWGRYLVVGPDGGKPIGYRRVTTVAKTLDSSDSLIPWASCATMVGALRRPGLMARWQSLVATHPDPWYSSEDSKKEAKRLVEECKVAGGSSDRADMGVALHSIVELIGKTGQSPVGLQPAMAADIDAWQQMLANTGISVATLEPIVVLDAHTVAGKPDMAETIVPGFDDPLIGDLKTGSDLTYAWRSIVVQLAAYAHADNIYEQGEAADGSQDRRLPMPPVSQQHAIVFHLPAGQAICTPYIIDIAVGWTKFQQSLAVDAWRKQKNLAVPLSDFLGAPSPVPAAALTAATAPAGPPPFDAAPTPAPTPAPMERAEQLDAVPDRMPDEGGQAHSLEVDTWRESYDRLRERDPDAAAWIKNLAVQAQNHQVSFHMSGNEAKTDRRVAILAGLVRLAKADAADDETLRALLSLVVRADWPQFANVPAGRALGLLDATEASTFADLALDLVDGRLRASVSDDGLLRFAAAA